MALRPAAGPAAADRARRSAPSGATVALASVCAAGLAACGSGRSGNGATSAGLTSNSGVRFAECIRAHGVPARVARPRQPRSRPVCEAAAELGRTSARLESARALIDYGSGLRHLGRRVEARADRGHVGALSVGWAPHSVAPRSTYATARTAWTATRSPTPDTRACAIAQEQSSDGPRRDDRPLGLRSRAVRRRGRRDRDTGL